MANANFSVPNLLPAQDVLRADEGFRALSPEPWLKLSPASCLPIGRPVEIRYSCGASDDVVRPIIRFIGERGSVRDELMPAAGEGSGVWRGRAPAGTRDIWINPTNRPGPFDFRLESLGPLSTGARLRAAFAAPKRAFFAAAARMVGLDAEADLNLRWVYGRADVQDYRTWLLRRASRAASAPVDAGPLALVVLTGGGSTADLVVSCASLVGQIYRNWRLVVPDLTPEQAVWLDAQSDARVARSGAPGAQDEVAGFSVRLRMGDRLSAHALLCAYAHFERHPEAQIVYADEIRTGPEGSLDAVFKPDWSPTRQAWAPYVGRAAFVRGGASPVVDSSQAPDRAIDQALAASPAGAIGHIRRPLFEIGRLDDTPSPRRRAPGTPARGRPKVGIVVPTRDRIDLLQPCLTSLFEKTSYADFEVAVVDNDSVDPRTSETLARIQGREPRLSVVSSPGAFNFSALCNLGAASLAGDLLVFLNNDTEILYADWLDNLAELAVLPDIGAVGAKLLYPDGRVQHAGVVLGLGGVAGHFGEGNNANAPGWLGGDLSPREASAVTAACLMVGRDKFEAVGGFDALNLPVELNDVDLCLRLGERGWRTLCDCRTTLLHHQSASRSGALRLQSVYEKERSYFTAKWRNVIRDDPYFNPNLSLYDYTPAIG